MVFYKKDNLRH